MGVLFQGFHCGEGIARGSQSDVPDHEGIGTRSRSHPLRKALLADMEFHRLRPRIGSDVHRLPMRHGADAVESAPKGH